MILNRDIATIKSGHQVSRLMTRLGWNQIELADELGMHPRTVGEMKSGKRKIKPYAALALSYIELMYLGGPEQEGKS